MTVAVHLSDPWDVVAAVPDPELPVLTIADLGILRDVRVAADAVEVTITPTYSGCPAIEAITADVEDRLHAAGHRNVAVRVVLAPAWTSDWVSAEGRHKLADYGIAPPRPLPGDGPVPLGLGVRCPACGSVETRLVSRFGSTACKAQHVCRACAEPFDEFKTH